MKLLPVRSLVLCCVVILSPQSADLITEGQQIISAFPTKTKILVLDEQASSESVLLAATLDIINDEESHRRTSSSRAE